MTTGNIGEWIRSIGDSSAGTGGTDTGIGPRSCAGVARRNTVSGGDKVGRAGGRLLSIGDLIVYRLPSFIGL